MTHPEPDEPVHGVRHSTASTGAAAGEGLAAADVSRLLDDLRRGERAALDRLFELVYQELRRLARRQFPRGRAGETLSTTALVHEVYLKFSRAAAVSASDQQHFFSLAARAMRQILVDHARRRAAARRPDPRDARPLDSLQLAAPAGSHDLLEVEGALQALEQLDPQLGRLVEWRVFAGLTLEEIADFGGRSVASLKRDWQKARAFLQRRLAAPGA